MNERGTRKNGVSRAMNASMQGPVNVRAHLDPELEAVLTGLTPLVYDDGGSVADDVPRHVRAASALRRVHERLVIVQDDVNVLAVHGAHGQTGGLLLPVGEGGRRVFDDHIGNKRAKMDMEACVRLPDGRLVAFGSGSTSARERIVVVEEDLKKVRVVEATALYARLRNDTAFSGSELNVEGAVVVGEKLRLFQRGNGAPRGNLSPVNATGDISLADFLRWLDDGERVPELGSVVAFDLGSSARSAFGFTDATLMEDGRIAFVACAEASPDAVRDGEVTGCRFGIIAGTDARVTDVVDGSGRAVTSKIEGIEARRDDHRGFDVVTDSDRPGEPAQLGYLRVTEHR